MFHSFFTGKNAVRMVGEPFLYGACISYRDWDGNLEHQVVFDKLEYLGIRCFLDKQCLRFGVDWERGFVEGLINSQEIVCVTSRNSLNHTDKDRNNICKLTEDPDCDNVLLEYRLAGKFSQS